MQDRELTDALTDPAGVFGAPLQVVASPLFRRSEKIEILRRWDYEAREDAAATGEGMPGDDPDTLSEVHGALDLLGVRIDSGGDAPTVTGGLAAGSVVDSADPAGQPDAIREAVAAFHQTSAFEAAIDDLEQNGFDRADISLLAGERAVRDKLHRYFVSTDDAEDDPDVPRVAYVSREAVGDAEGALIGGGLYLAAIPTALAMVAGGGPLGAAFITALLAGGVGMGIGSALARIVGHRYADYLAHQLDSGGILLWVRTTSAEREKKAVEILKRHSGEDVHVHGLPSNLERRFLYRGRLVEDYGDGVFAMERLFPSLEAAEEAIDRTLCKRGS